MSPDLTKQYWVRYLVTGFGPRAAGPYSGHEVESHYFDISGYECVYGTRLEEIDYKCSTCGASGIKLWRECESKTPLLCFVCAEEDQAAKNEPGWRSQFASGVGDQIGLYIPAVPSEDGSFHPYTFTPKTPSLWWSRLPRAAV